MQPEFKKVWHQVTENVKTAAPVLNAAAVSSGLLIGSLVSIKLGLVPAEHSDIGEITRQIHAGTEILGIIGMVISAVEAINRATSQD